MAGNSLEYVTKIVHEGNGHLKICSLSEAIDTCRQFLLLRTDILQKTVVPLLKVRPTLGPKLALTRLKSP